MGMYFGSKKVRFALGNMPRGNGLTDEEKDLILSLFKAATYTEDVSEKVAELEALWSVSFKVSYSLTGVTASNNASAVVEGGKYITTLTAEGGYSLSNAEVSVTMGGVDITSTAYKNGVITIEFVTGDVVITVVAKEIPTYTVTNNLTNVTNSNEAIKVTEGDFYSANLSWDSAYRLNSIVVTMGGVDVTADVYGEGKILITEVTGDVVITAEAGIPVLYQLANTPVTCNADLYEDTGLTFGSSSANGIKEAWTMCITVTPSATSWIAGLTVSNQNLYDAFLIWVHSNTQVNCAFGRGSNVCYSGNTIGNTLKFVIVHEAGSTNLVTNYYAVDGVLTNTESKSTYGNLANSDYIGSFMIGGAWNARYKGTIEDFTIYGTVLPEADIKAYLGVA